MADARFHEAQPERLVRGLLAQQAESRSLDYKASIAFGPDKLTKAEILKWLMAFSNTRDGGYIVIGVREKNAQFVPEGIDDGAAASFDPTKVGTFAKNYCSVLPKVSSQVVSVDGCDLLLLRIDEFGDEPVVCIKDLYDSKNQVVLRAGAIYVRTQDARSAQIASSEDMRALLDLAVVKRGDALLGQIGKLVGVAPAIVTRDPSEAYKTELDSAYRIFNAKNISAPYWYFEILPIEYVENRVPANNRLREVRRETVVALRGWNFPHVDHRNDENFESGIQSYINWTRHHEAHRLYKSGLFAWRRRLSEDFSEEYKGALSYVSSIYSLTEFLMFASRYVTKIMDDGNVMLRCGITGLSSRPLRMDARNFHDEFETGATNFAWSYTASIGSLRSSHMELASTAARVLFDLYGLDIKPEVIGDWQKNLVERRFL